MGQRPARFRQIEVTRALRAAAGLKGRFEVEIDPDGTIRIKPAEYALSAPTDDPADWERRLRAATGWQK
jgi:hypothetical protein